MFSYFETLGVKMAYKYKGSPGDKVDSREIKT